VVVGNGAPKQAARFHDEFQLPFPLYTDPRLVSYRAAGLRRALSATFNPRILGNFGRSLGRGHRQGLTQGSAFQQGGVFLITPENRIVYEQRSQVAGDHPEPEEILTALRRHVEEVE
jgi:hypothetical protein